MHITVWYSVCSLHINAPPAKSLNASLSDESIRHLSNNFTTWADSFLLHIANKFLWDIMNDFVVGFTSWSSAWTTSKRNRNLHLVFKGGLLLQYQSGSLNQKIMTPSLIIDCTPIVAISAFHHCLLGQSTFWWISPPLAANAYFGSLIRPMLWDPY